MIRISILLSLLVFSMAGKSFAQENELDQLAWLVGSWEYRDEQIDGEYEEAGIRECGFALDKSYIRCESNGQTNTGKQRNYVWFLNYNGLDQRFEMMGVFSDYPRKLLYSATVSDDGHRIEIINNAWLPEDLVRLGTAIVQYDGEKKYVWSITSTNQGTGETTRFRDTAVRTNEKD